MYISFALSPCKIYSSYILKLYISYILSSYILNTSSRDILINIKIKRLFIILIIGSNSIFSLIDPAHFILSINFIRSEAYINYFLFN